MKLPIWIHTLSHIINRWFIYVDKTKEIINLLKSSSYTLLLRHRLFWKSLLIDTIKELYIWNKDLFKGLYAYDNWDFNKTNPVIHLSFDDRSLDLRNIFLDSLIYVNWEAQSYYSYIEQYWLNWSDLSIVIRHLSELLWKQVVVLVDSYDKPYNNSLRDKVKYEKFSIFFENFYGWIKDSASYIEYFMLCWVNKVYIMSLNNLNDISYNTDYSDIVWYTDHDLNNYFNINNDNLIIKVCKYFWWYKFWWDIDIYNPWVINSFSSNDYIFDNYWMATWSPDFILDLIDDIQLNRLIYVIEHSLDNWHFLYDTYTSYISITNKDWYILSLLVNSWYLTVKNTSRWFKTYIPNNECKIALSSLYKKILLKKWYEISDITDFDKDNLYFWLIEWNSQRVVSSLNAMNEVMMSPISYQWTWNNPEGVFKIFLQQQLLSMGLIVIWEGSVQEWRMDMVVIIDDRKIIIETKVDTNTTDALNQIENQYYSQLTPGTIAVWINWNRTKKNKPLFEVDFIQY